MRAFACSQVLRKFVSVCEGLQAEVDSEVIDGRHDAGEDLGGEVGCLLVGHARQEVALLGRAEDHQRAPEVVRRLGQPHEIIGRLTPDRRVGGRQVEALGLGEQPVQADRLEAGVLDLCRRSRRSWGDTSVIRGARVKGAISRPS